MRMMMVGRGAMALPRRPIVRPKCLASSNINTEHLRAELDQLHTEAETTRAKASSARLRLLRLSEAAENLRRQAAVNVHKGKENEARELLFQKKKVMQALEKAKARIELLDQLSLKLSEAITLKETQLIGTIALDLEVNKEDDSSPVRIVSPKQEPVEDEDEFENSQTVVDDRNLRQFSADSEKSTLVNTGMEELQSSVGVRVSCEGETASSVSQISSYEFFLGYLDSQLNKLEAELVTVLNVSTLVLNHEEQTPNLKVQEITELLESIRSVRQRIANIMQSEDKIN